MKNKTLMRISNISGWLLLVVLVLYFISGYAMVREYGMNHLMSHHGASELHESLAAMFFILLFLHIVPYYYVRKQLNMMVLILLIVLILPVLGVFAVNKVQDREESNVKPSVQNEKKSSQEVIPSQQLNTAKDKDKKSAVRCEGCGNECLIKPGEKGECGQVKNVDGKLVPAE